MSDPRTAAEYANELLEVTDEWAPAGDIDPDKLASALAAAEERGRRRGVEDLQTMLQNAAPHIIGAGHFRLWNCKCGYCAPLQAALAPRDSGKVAMVKEFTREEAVAMFGPRKDRP